MNFYTYFKHLLCLLGCHIHAGIAAFDAWSPIKTSHILIWGFMIYIMDSMIRRWLSIASASRGNIFKYKPVPGKDLKLNWEYIDTLDNVTRLNFHRVIAVFHGRLHYAGYSKLDKFPVNFLLISFFFNSM